MVFLLLFGFKFVVKMIHFRGKHEKKLYSFCKFFDLRFWQLNKRFEGGYSLFLFWKNTDPNFIHSSLKYVLIVLGQSSKSFDILILLEDDIYTVFMETLLFATSFNSVSWLFNEFSSKILI